MVLIIMGVSGSGKTLIGEHLSERLQLPFYDADAFHPQANIEKMADGIPLNDDDRRPWLESIAGNMEEWDSEEGAVLACSALKQAYRDLLKKRSGVNFRLIYLKGSRSLIARRLSHRSGHFFDPSLLDSQFQALEEPRDALTVSIDQPPEQIVAEIISKLERAAE